MSLAGLLTYETGNDSNPADPWGRSELAVHPDGSCWLRHRYSRRAGAGCWFGRVDPGALSALSVAIDRAGLGEHQVPQPPLVPDAAVRRLAILTDGRERVAAIGWHQTSALPGYAEAFDLIDGIVRQLSGETVRYPTTHRDPIVRDIASFATPVAAILAISGQPARGHELDRNGLDRNGLERNGPDRNGPDRNGLERNGPDRNGLDRNGLDRNGLERAIAQGRVLVVRYWSTIGDGEAWCDLATELSFDRDGNPSPSFLVFPRPIPGVLARAHREAGWDSTAEVYDAFGVGT